MSRRFQFSLRALFVATAIVGACCATFIALPPSAKIVVVLASASVIVEATAVTLLWLASKLTRRLL